MTMAPCHSLAMYHALIIAGILFGFISLFHLLRVAYQAHARFGDRVIPLWVTFLGFIFFMLISGYMFRVSIW